MYYLCMLLHPWSLCLRSSLICNIRHHTFCKLKGKQASTAPLDFGGQSIIKSANKYKYSFNQSNHQVCYQNMQCTNALARAYELKTTPPTDKEPPLADRKRCGNLYGICLFPFDADGGSTTILVNAYTFLCFSTIFFNDCQHLCIAKASLASKLNF